jgi:hypothetical protein
MRTFRLPRINLTMCNLYSMTRAPAWRETAQTLVPHSTGRLSTLATKATKDTKRHRPDYRDMPSMHSPRAVPALFDSVSAERAVGMSVWLNDRCPIGFPFTWTGQDRLEVEYGWHKHRLRDWLCLGNRYIRAEAYYDIRLSEAQINE